MEDNVIQLRKVMYMALIEIEQIYLDILCPKNQIAVDIGANYGDYTENFIKTVILFIPMSRSLNYIINCKIDILIITEYI